MLKLDPTLYLPLLALILGVILHSISADGGASILDRFKIEWRLPAKAIPPLVLVFGIAAGGVDNLLAGQDVQHAVVTAAIATLTGFFGVTSHHAKTAVLVLAIFVGVAGTQVACAPLLHEARVVTQDMGQCLSDNADLPDDKAFEKCGIEEALREAARNILAHEREKRTRIALEAKERGARDALLQVVSEQLAKEAAAKKDAELRQAREAAQKCGDGGVYQTPSTAGDGGTK